MTRVNAGLAVSVMALVVSLLSPAGFAAETAAPVQPAASAQPPQAQESAPLEELDEIVVRGKRILERIVEAEDVFYKLFNDLNKDDRYDTHCVFLQAQEGSRIQTRSCIPGFVADAMADWAPFRARCQPPQEMKYGIDGPEFACLDRNSDGRLSFEEASAREELGSAFFEIDQEGDKNGSISGQEFIQALESRGDLASPAVYQPPTPDAVLVNGTQKWHDHMTAVVKSDPRLHKMADELGQMYYELSLAQRKFNELDSAEMEKAGKRSKGVRVR
jgi:hypothetical protein